MNEAEFLAQFPGLFFLDPRDLAGLNRYLSARGLLEHGESLVSAERAGEGNMNCTLRARTERRSLIVKQSRPWVENYPHIAAPMDRACRELEFHRLCQGIPWLRERMPLLLHGDPDSRILVMEDLGEGGDYSDIYDSALFPEPDLAILAKFLSELHAAYVGLETRPSLANREMRALNHAHIFEIPLRRDNGLDLNAITPGLEAVAEEFRADEEFLAEVARLGQEVYLADGPNLLHGDFFPGSFTRTAQGPKVIDFEFAFFGRAEFDVSVLFAHLILAGQPLRSHEFWLQACAPTGDFDIRLVHQLAGVEIMRRILGYAQLPLCWTLAEKTELLRKARAMVLD